MNTYTERSGATHVCSGQLLSELRERGTSEGLHRSRISSVMHECVLYRLNVIIQPLVGYHIPFNRSIIMPSFCADNHCLNPQTGQELTLQTQRSCPQYDIWKFEDFRQPKQKVKIIIFTIGFRFFSLKTKLVRLNSN